MFTVICSVVVPNGSDPKPVVSIILPGGETHRATLHDHDWTYDYQKGQIFGSLMRHLRHLGWENPHGYRLAYDSPADVGVTSNEAGRLQVWEVDYDG